MTEISKIEIQPDGPYKVTGGVPVRSYETASTKAGEPLAWRPGEAETTKKTVMLCRCGQSDKAPYCDGSHTDVGFDGTETAATNRYGDRAEALGGATITVFDDRSICEHAGFCGNEQSNIWKMAKRSPNGADEALMTSMVSRCPSGALTYVFSGDVVEEVLPCEVRVVADGPLWVTGGIPIERSDGEPFETRNRVTLCRCGRSSNKPLCDGSHGDSDEA